MKKPKLYYFKGPCPFLLCLETGPHSHPICPRCGAVKYGNVRCPECLKHMDINEETRELFMKAYRDDRKYLKLVKKDETDDET